ncbi:MAG: hypothetical protein ACJKTH_02000 [Patescibacteria group bacterium UBA2163]
MQNIIVGIVLLLVGFFGGYFVSGNTLSEEHNIHSETEEHGDSGHAMEHSTPVDVPAGASAPAVALEVFEDPMSGWNVKITTENFRFSPENASQDHILGEGHAHVYVDGEKINRVYGSWYHLGDLSVGEHEIKVNLNANNHNPYSVNGVLVEDSVTVVVEPEPEFDAANAKMMSLSLTNRTLSPEMVTVSEGDSVHLMVNTDEAGEFHIAGYEVVQEMSTDGATSIMFVADQAGRYALEFHPNSGGHMDEEDHGTMEDIEIGSLLVNP